MDWKSLIIGFESYLLLEKALAKNTIEAYLRDVNRLAEYFQHEISSPTKLTLPDLQSFTRALYDIGVATSTQARIISGVKAFYKFLLMEDILDDDPTELLEGPKIGKKLPEFLTHEEVGEIISSIDLSKPEGTRNKAIIETLYSCGLRVTELTELKLSNIYHEEGFIRVIGKGDKERLVPIGSDALKHVDIYVKEVRRHQKIGLGCEDVVFLNRRGATLSRVMIFNIIKELAVVAQINKTISPHTFRHSFATSLVTNGANLRAVQEMLGHASITTTEIYTHLDRDYLRKTILNHHPMYRNKTLNEK